MKTIAERAREYAENEDLVQGTDGYEYCLRDYIKGATEQKVIDIDKACEWLGVHLAEVADRYDSTASLLLRHVKENFRIAMEKEL